MGRCNQITNICVRVDWWKQSIGIDYYSGGGGVQDTTETYQDLFLNEVTTDLYETSYRPSDSGVEVWADLSTVTAADIPNSDDALATIPNSGTGADLFQNTVGARPLYKTAFSKYLEPIVSGTRTLTDSWWRYQVKCTRIEAGQRIQITPSVENPTYLEGFISYCAKDAAVGVIWSHRSEATRLLQIGINGSGFYQFQLRSSGNVLQTITSTVFSRSGKSDIIYFRFNKSGNSHAISVNGETEVVNTTNFGAETFNATEQNLGAFLTTGPSYQNGATGNYYEIILKYSAFTAQDKSDCLKYLRGKYLEFRQSTTPVYTPKTNTRLIAVGENVKSIIEAIADDTHIKLAVGEHVITDDILITASNINIEVPTGCTLKRGDNSTSFNLPELVFNQLPPVSVETQGTYMGANAANFWIKIDANGTPDTFSWHKQATSETGQPSPYDNTGVAITGDWQTLSDGIQIRFTSTTGNTIGNGAIVAIGSTFYIFRIGNGFQVSSIENIKIFGSGVLNGNQSNNKAHSQHSVNVPYAVLFWGRTKNCGVYGLTIQDIHRSVGAYGDHNGTYLTGGGVSGGESFDAEFVDVIKTDIQNSTAGKAGILIGHPEHRGWLDFYRIFDNTCVCHSTNIEPNFKTRRYLVRVNTVTRLDDAVAGVGVIAAWRKSEQGAIIDNTQVTSTKTIVSESAPPGWETPLNILDNNNVTI